MDSKVNRRSWFQAILAGLCGLLAGLAGKAQAAAKAPPETPPASATGPQPDSEITYCYDSHGNGVTTYTYSSGQLTSITDGPGTATTYTFTSDGSW